MPLAVERASSSAEQKADSLPAKQRPQLDGTRCLGFCTRSAFLDDGIRTIPDSNRGVAGFNHASQCDGAACRNEIVGGFVVEFDFLAHLQMLTLGAALPDNSDFHCRTIKA